MALEVLPGSGPLGCKRPYFSELRNRALATMRKSSSLLRRCNQEADLAAGGQASELLLKHHPKVKEHPHR